jgi:hypothetical protein
MRNLRKEVEQIISETCAGMDLGGVQGDTWAATDEIIKRVREHDRAGTDKQADCKAMAKAMYQKQCEYVGRDHEGKCVEMLETAFLSFEADIHAQRAKTIEACLAAFYEQMDLLEIASGDSGDRIVIDTCRELGGKAIIGVNDG